MEENPNNTGFTFDNFKMGDTQASSDAAYDNVITRWFDPNIAEEAQFQRENYMVDKANAFNEYMYNKALQDNSPVAQMERAREAGINLNLAAEGIMGGGNAVATPMQGAQGGAAMNNATESPFDMFNKAMNATENATDTINKIGELAGFGKKNKAEIKQINALADKAAEEADFTFWQKRQFRRTMRIMYDQAQANMDQTEANIKNLQKLYEVYEQQKWNTAADTTLKTAQTGEVIENTKNIQYKNFEEEFKKVFRDLYGVQLNESDMSMLVQAILGGHGKQIMDGIVDCFTQIVESIGKGLKNGITNQITDAQKRFDKWLENREQKRQFKRDGNERRQIMKEYSKNAKWVFEHSYSLRKKYNNNFKDYFYNEYLPKKGIKSYVPQ